MTLLRIDLDDDAIDQARQRPQRLLAELHLAAAADLYARGRMSLDAASRLAGVSASTVRDRAGRGSQRRSAVLASGSWVPPDEDEEGHDPVFLRGAGDWDWD